MHEIRIQRYRIFNYGSCDERFCPREIGRCQLSQEADQCLDRLFPGGGSDVMFSMVRPQLEKALNATLVPVYKPGAGSDIAATELAMSKPDGYTVFISCTPMIPINTYVRETSYKTSDLALVANVVTDPGFSWSGRKAPIRRCGYPQGGHGEAGTVGVGVASAPGMTGLPHTCSKRRRKPISTSSHSVETVLPGRPRWPATSTPPPTTWELFTLKSKRAHSGRWRS